MAPLQLTGPDPSREHRPPLTNWSTVGVLWACNGSCGPDTDEIIGSSCPIEAVLGSQDALVSLGL
jgi:hypothetical protein